MTVSRRLRGLGLASLLVTGALLIPRPSLAHPLGNFSISHYAGIKVSAKEIELRYLIDMAEIPTFQELQERGLGADADRASADAYIRRTAESLKEGLHLNVDGQRLVLRTFARDILFSPGAGGLPTMKLGIVYHANFDPVTRQAWHHVDYRDLNFPDRNGWKEVVAVGGPGIIFSSSSVSERSRSRELADYPTDMLNSPPQTLEARLVFGSEQLSGPVGLDSPGSPSTAARSLATTDGMVRPAGPTANTDAEASVAEPRTRFASRAELALQPNQGTMRRDAFTDLIRVEQTGIRVFFFAALVAAALGAFHALEPGHGKTVVAAYLVGSRGTARHAMLLGLMVTLSHTAGVYVLGGVTLYTSRYIVPERLYPWLGVISGLTIAGLGFVLFLRRYAGEHHHSHDHEHPHGHYDPSAPDHAPIHVDSEHAHRGHRHVHLPARAGVVRLRELLALGVTGGLVPCPAALVVLLSAVAFRRVGFGMLLIVAFSVGLAAVLIAIGIFMVYAARFMTRFQMQSRFITRWLPLTSSAVIVTLGLAITVQALMSAGIVQVRLG